MHVRQSDVGSAFVVNDEDHLDVVMDLMQKYNLQMVPVRDTDGVLVGIILLNDLIHEYVRF